MRRRRRRRRGKRPPTQRGARRARGGRAASAEEDRHAEQKRAPPTAAPSRRARAPNHGVPGGAAGRDQQRRNAALALTATAAGQRRRPPATTNGHGAQRIIANRRFEIRLASRSVKLVRAEDAEAATSIGSTPTHTPGCPRMRQGIRPYAHDVGGTAGAACQWLKNDCRVFTALPALFAQRSQHGAILAESRWTRGVREVAMDGMHAQYNSFTMNDACAV
eukprot:COSAG06_NODE_19339_length_843_cov_0.845430_1_plen_220_part_00